MFFNKWKFLVTIAILSFATLLFVYDIALNKENKIFGIFVSTIIFVAHKQHIWQKLNYQLQNKLKLRWMEEHNAGYLLKLRYLNRNYQKK